MNGVGQVAPRDNTHHGLAYTARRARSGRTVVLDPMTGEFVTAHDVLQLADLDDTPPTTGGPYPCDSYTHLRPCDGYTHLGLCAACVTAFAQIGATS